MLETHPPSNASAEESNRGLIERAYVAFASGDIPAVFGALADDIIWHVPGRGPLSRNYRGHAEVLGFFLSFLELAEGTFRIRVHDVLAKGDHVIVLVTESARRRGREWSSPQVHVWTVRGGRATGFREFQGDQQSEDEFWSAA